MIQPFYLSLTPQQLLLRGISLFIYRGDLENPVAPGNKWHKLKYNIEKAQQNGAQHIISFGGPYSNHLHALGNICHHYGIKPVAIVRGELQPQLTSTLIDFVKQGGVLWPSSRLDYKLGIQSDFAKEINRFYSNAYWVPEGGSNAFGVEGCFDWANQIRQAEANIGIEFDLWALSAGTGATSAGFLSNTNAPDIMVFPALKGGEKLLVDIHTFALNQNKNTQLDKLSIASDYHFGGYAKLPIELQNYINQIHGLNYGIRLDPIYTAKVVYGLEQEIRKNRLMNKKILIIHTGGLQGWSGFDQRSLN